MKVLIATEGKTLEDKVAPSLGHSPYFLLVETWTGDVKPIVNDAVKEKGDNTDTITAHTVAGYGVDMILARSLGPVAARAFESSGIPVYKAEPVSARDALKSLLNAPFLERLDMLPG